MTPGPTLILACPACGALVRQRSLASGNTFGATLWSDGFFDAPMLPEAPALMQCPAGHWFWLEDAEEIARDDWFRRDMDAADTPPAPGAWANAPFAADLSAADLAEALAAGLGDTLDREAHLRLRLWWAANDVHRGADTPPTPDLANLERLQALQNDATLNELSLDDDGWDLDEDEPEEDEDETLPTERAEPVLRAAVAHALAQPDRARLELDAARLPPEWFQAFAAAIARGERRVVALA